MEKYNCDMVFGSRWMKGAKVIDYPKQKFLLNRFVNNLIRFIFGFKYNDVTNGFKLFSKKTITGVKPFLSGQFSLALEIPLKAIIRGYSYRVVSTNWYNREVGQSNLRLTTMGPKYLYIFLICFVEHISLKFGSTTEQ
jgi:dolichol-phosphate mannosyltransferase